MDNYNSMEEKRMLNHNSTPLDKAEQLIKKYGKKSAIDICNEIILAGNRSWMNEVDAVLSAAGYWNKVLDTIKNIKEKRKYFNLLSRYK